MMLSLSMFMPKSNPNACGFEIYSPNKAPATHGITQNKYAVILTYGFWNRVGLGSLVTDETFGVAITPYLKGEAINDRYIRQIKPQLHTELPKINML
jgi:hypothetical protein